MLKWLWLAATVLVVDQAGKWLVSQWLVLHEQHPVAPFFNLTLVYNYGAAFSFLSDAGGWQRWLFTLLAVAISILIVVWLKRLQADEKWTALSLTLVLGGALGNLIDRMVYGYVIDFLDVYYGNWHWPTFNVADSAITVGAAILIVHTLLFRRETETA